MGYWRMEGTADDLIGLLLVDLAHRPMQTVH